MTIFYHLIKAVVTKGRIITLSIGNEDTQPDVMTSTACVDVIDLLTIFGNFKNNVITSW